MKKLSLFSAAVLSGLALFQGSASAQDNPPMEHPSATIQNGGRPDGEYNGVPLYRVRVVARDLDAVNYLHRKGSTNIPFRGTELLPGAKGEAKVTAQDGRVNIDARFSGLTPANGFAPEYLTYVLWAITPEGSPQNLGEIQPGKDMRIQVSSPVPAFGMIVTAEPYFAVRVPSNLVVLQNVVDQDRTNGITEKVNAHVTLLPRGAYTFTAGPNTVPNPITRNERSPLDLFEAHNAYNIAIAAGADKYAADIMAQARQDIKNADDMDQNPHGDRKMVITNSRGATQRAEDARIATLRKRVAEERQAEIDARRAAEASAASSAAAAAQSQQQAEEAARAKAQADAAAAAANASAAQSAADAERAKADAARRIREMREQLRAQLNTILVTTETDRGLQINLSDVLFDTGKSALKPDTKISLAKVSVIIASHPDLKLQVEGYTDSVGGDTYNQKLSEDRAESVKAFLIANSVDPGNVTSIGYGKSHPVADNGSAQGRQQNRRVELIVSGPSIGYTTQQQPQ